MIKKSQATKNKGEQAITLSKIRIEQLFLESWLIVQAFLGLFIILSLTSYSSLDPGWTSNTYTPGIIENEIVIRNIVGSWGAYVSDFLYFFIGYMSFLIPYWLLWPVIRHFFLSRVSTSYLQTEPIIVSIKFRFQFF